jgi:hypothetical protein
MVKMLGMEEPLRRYPRNRGVLRDCELFSQFRSFVSSILGGLSVVEKDEEA